MPECDVHLCSLGIGIFFLPSVSWRC